MFTELKLEIRKIVIFSLSIEVLKSTQRLNLFLKNFIISWSQNTLHHMPPLKASEHGYAGLKSLFY